MSVSRIVKPGSFSLASGQPRVFSIKNFDGYQQSPSELVMHKKGSPLPWIKLYYRLFLDPDFFRLSAQSKLLYIGLLTLAAQSNGNVIRDDPQWVGHCLALENVDFEPLIQAGFLVVQDPACNPLVNYKRPTSIDGEEDERRGRRERERARDKSARGFVP
jgi:hypothetical protein